MQYALESALAIIARLLVLAAFCGGLIALLDEPSELGLDGDNLRAVVAALFGVSLLTASVARRQAR